MTFGLIRSVRKTLVIPANIFTIITLGLPESVTEGAKLRPASLNEPDFRASPVPFCRSERDHFECALGCVFSLLSSSAAACALRPPSTSLSAYQFVAFSDQPRASSEFPRCACAMAR